MCKIVIVDDVKKVRDELKSHLTEMFPEHEIFDFAGTKRALNKVSELKFVDIIVFNSLKNKNPNGIEFAKVLREKSPATILIYTTGTRNPNYEHMNKLAKVGIDSYLIRPFTRESLSFMVINSLNRIDSFQTYRSKEHNTLETAVDSLINKFNTAIQEQLSPPQSKWGFLKFFTRS